MGNGSKSGMAPNTSGGAGGGYDLPPLLQALSNNHGSGTYRGAMSLKTSGNILPSAKSNNPPGSGAHRTAMEPKTSAVADKLAKKFK
ncbi:NOT2/NOT3/NOT5 family protein [Apiospora arundinis]